MRLLTAGSSVRVRQGEPWSGRCLGGGPIFIKRYGPLAQFTGKITKLEGHLSRISRLKFNGPSLYTASYDNSVRLWNTSSEKIDPMTLISTNSWMMDFTFDNSKQFAWIGDYNGNLSEVLLSVPEMAERISRKLKRDFTREEWNYYIGSNVPYESFKK